MTLGDLIIKIGGDTSQFNNAIKQTKSTLTGFGDTVLAGIGVGIGAEVFQALQNGMMGVVNSFKEGIQYASDLTEVQNVVDTAFGQSAQAVNQWASTTLASFGLTELQAKQMAGSMRAMLGSMGILPAEADRMSMSLTELAGDFASFYNLSHDEAWGKIRAGIAGETEPLKSLGINMSVANMEAYALTKGITKTWNALSQSEQALLRYNYLMESGKLAVGDFAKTQSSYANQLRVFNGMLLDFKGKMAEAFIPMTEKILELANKILPKLQNAMKPIVEYIEKTVMPILQNEFNYLANVLFPLIFSKLEEFGKTLKTSGIKEALKTLIPDVFVEMAFLVKDLFSWLIEHQTIVKTVLVSIGAGFLVFKTITTLVGIATGVVKAFGTVVAFITSPIGIATVAIGALAGMAYLIYRNWQPISQFFKDLWNTVVKEFEVAKARVDLVLKTLGSAMASHFEFVLGNTLTFVQGIINLFSKIPGLEDKFAGVNKIIANVKTAVEQSAYGANKAYADAKNNVLKAERAMEESWNRATASSKKAFDSLKTDITGSFKDIKEKATSMFSTQKQDSKTTTDSIDKDFTNATNKINQSVMAIDKGTTESLKNVKKLASDNTKAVSDSFEKMKNEAVAKTNKMGDAIITALKNQYSKQEKERTDALNKDLNKVRMNTNKVIREYERELQAKLGIIDADTRESIRLAQQQIDALNKLTDKEEKALREQEYNNEVANKQKELLQVKSAYEQERLQAETNADLEMKDAKSANEKEKIQKELNKTRTDLAEKFKNEQLKIQTELNNMYKQKERENLLALRQQQIDSWNDEIKRIQENAEIERKELEKEYKNKITHEENMLKVKQANIQEELNAVKQYYADLSTEENIQAEARKLFLSQENDKIINLLNEYNPKWQSAGESWGESLLAGINAKKKSIQQAVTDLLALVNTTQNIFETQKPIGPSYYSPETGMTFNPPKVTNTPTISNGTIGNITTNTNAISTLGGTMNVQVNLDGRTIAKASAPAMVKELKLQGVYT